MIEVMTEIEFRRDSKGRAIAKGAILGDPAYLGNNVTIYPEVRLGSDVVVMDGAVIGRIPIGNRTVNLEVSSTFSEVSIGDQSIIGCNAVLYTGLKIGRDVLVADLASIREGNVIGDGCVVGRGVMLLAGSTIGQNSRIQDQAHIAGNSVIEEEVFIGMGAVLTNDNDVYRTRFGLTDPVIRGPTIRRYALIGAGATLLPGIELGEGSIVAAGAVVTKDVRPWSVVAGVPARVMKNVPDEWRQQIESLKTN